MTQTAWFKFGVQAFQLARPGAPKCYPCPICLRGFPSATGLSREDVPPESQGGRKIVLTCRDCNSLAGHKLDTAMLALEQTYDFACGTLERPMRQSRLTIANQVMNVETRAVGKAVEIAVLPASNSPSAQTTMMTELKRRTAEDDWEGLEFKISNIGYRHSHAAVGWLRAGYLGLFARLGYCYIMRPQLDNVRKQITSPERRLLKSYLLTNLRLEKDVFQILMIQQPKWLENCFAVRMGRHIVFLPGFDPRTSVYRRLRQHGSENSGIEITGAALRWPSEPEFMLDFRS